MVISCLVVISILGVLNMCCVMVECIRMWCCGEISRFVMGSLFFSVLVWMWMGCRCGVSVRFMWFSL